MKKWALILAAILCVIAIGGLAVLFRVDEPTQSGGQNSTVEQPSGDDNSSSDEDTPHIPIQEIELDKIKILF